MGIHTFYVGKEKIIRKNIDQKQYLAIVKQKEKEQTAKDIADKKEFASKTEREKINLIAKKLDLIQK